MRHCVEHVADRNDPSLLCNRLTDESSGVTSSVMSLVVLLGKHCSNIKNLKLQLAQKLSTVSRMVANNLALAGGQDIWLQQYARRNGDHPDVAKLRCACQQVTSFLVPTKCYGQVPGQAGYTERTV